MNTRLIRMAVSALLVVPFALALSIAAPKRYKPFPPRVFQPNANNTGQAQPNSFQDPQTGDVFEVSGLPSGGRWETINNLLVNASGLPLARVISNHVTRARVGFGVRMPNVDNHQSIPNT